MKYVNEQIWRAGCNASFGLAREANTYAATKGFTRWQRLIRWLRNP